VSSWSRQPPMTSGWQLPLTFLLALSGVMGATQAAAGERVRVGVHENAPVAFLDRDGRPQGLCLDLLRYTAKREGWELEFVPMTRAEALERLSRGEIDLIPGLAVSEELSKQFDFGGAAVLKTWLQVYVEKGEKVESALDLAGKRIAVVRDSAGAELLRKELARCGVECSLQEHDDYAAVLSAVSSGHAAAGLVSRTYGVSHGKSYDAYRAPIMIYLQEVRFAAPKGRGGRLLEALDRHVQALMAEKGSLYYRSLGEWLGGGDETSVWFYVLLCLIVPPLWAVLTYFVFGLFQKRLARRKSEPAAADGVRQ
jgi:ABC-type amino acid transport substrate-binding protein